MCQSYVTTLLINPTYIHLCLTSGATDTFNPSSPTWEGAWWIGYVCIGTAMVVCAIPLAMFPRSLPRLSSKRKAKKEAEQERNGQEMMNKTEVSAPLAVSEDILLDKFPDSEYSSSLQGTVIDV